MMKQTIENMIPHEDMMSITLAIGEPKSGFNATLGGESRGA